MSVRRRDGDACGAPSTGVERAAPSDIGMVEGAIEDALERQRGEMRNQADSLEADLEMERARLP